LSNNIIYHKSTISRFRPALFNPADISDIVAIWDANQLWDGTSWQDTVNGIYLNPVTDNPIYSPTHDPASFSGNGGLYFDGSKRLIDYTLSSLLGVLSNGLTFFIVTDCENVNTTPEVSCDLRFASSYGVYIAYDLDHWMSVYYGPTARANYVTEEARYEQPHIIGLRAGTSLVDFFLSGDQLVKRDGSSVYDAGTGKLFSIGSDNQYGRYFTGHISEIIFYKRELTLPEFLSVNDYLCSKWGITNEYSANDGYSTNFLQGVTTYDANLATTATFVASSSSQASQEGDKLNDLTYAGLWQTVDTNPTIEATWASDQTISKVQLVSFSNVTETYDIPSYVGPVHIYYWDGAGWVSAGVYDFVGSTLEVVFRDTITTSKLKFSIGEELGSLNYILREILVF